MFSNLKIKEKTILTPFNYTPLSLGIYLAAKLMGIKRLNVFTDLSSDIINQKRQKDMIWVKKCLLPFYLKLINFVEKNYDMYILFTEEMNKKVNPKNKPYLVLEGIYNNQLDLKHLKKEKAIMYAGTLAYEYGIKNILDAFEQLENSDLQLWIFGDGDMKDYIKELSVRDKRVKFFGFQAHNKVFEYEKKATLLVNARNPEDEYTFYSFPSKTFEYMVSGTPFLTTKLKGIPEEYYKYVFTIDEYNVESLKQKMEGILSINQEKLDELGEDARRFILENKNSLVQSAKIIHKIQKMIQ